MVDKNYSFINKEKLKSRAKSLNPKVEAMYEGFYNFLELEQSLSKENFLDFSYLSERCGLTKKLLEKLKKAVEKYREMYFKMMMDIFQTRIEDFTK